MTDTKQSKGAQMTDRTHPDSGRIITRGDVIAELHDRIAELEAELEAVGAGGVQALAAAAPVVPAPQPADAEAWDAELGRVAMRFVDRAGDVHPGIDDAERICAEFYAAMIAVIERMPHVQRMGVAAPKADPETYHHGPQATTIEEAARDVGKWLNERPNRPIDLRHVAMLCAHAQPAARAQQKGGEPA